MGLPNYFHETKFWPYLQVVICNAGRQKPETENEKAARLCRKRQALLRVVIRKATGHIRHPVPGENNLLLEFTI